MRFIPWDEPEICIQCGRSDKHLVEIEVEEQLLRYCVPGCWDTVGTAIARRFGIIGKRNQPNPQR